VPTENQADNAADIARYSSGILALEQGHFARAAGELEGLLGRDGMVGQVSGFLYAACQRALSIEAVARADLAAAEGHLRLAVRSGARPGDLTGQIAAFFARAGRPADGLRAMERAVESAAAARGNSSDARRNLAVAQWQAGKREEAYLTLRQAFRRFGGVAALHLQMGLFLAGEDRYAEAQPWLARAVEADCGNADAHYYLALALAAQGDARSAVRSFQRALDLRPDDVMLAHQLSLAARAAGQQGLKVTIRLSDPWVPAASGDLAGLAAYVAAEPDFVEAFCCLPAGAADADGLVLLAGAVALALRRHAGHADLYLAGSMVLARLGQTAGAIAQAERALVLNGRYVRARLHLADLYAGAGAIEEAAGQIDRAIADGADWPDVHLRAGQLHARCHRRQRAQQHLRRALELKADYAPAALALAGQALADDASPAEAA
jgi:tetratricopeptide (TPR) repeat protein